MSNYGKITERADMVTINSKKKLQLKNKSLANEIKQPMEGRSDMEGRGRGKGYVEAPVDKCQ